MREELGMIFSTTRICEARLNSKHVEHHGQSPFVSSNNFQSFFLSGWGGLFFRHVGFLSVPYHIFTPLFKHFLANIDNDRVQKRSKFLPQLYKVCRETAGLTTQQNCFHTNVAFKNRQPCAQKVGPEHTMPFLQSNSPLAIPISRKVVPWRPLTNALLRSWRSSRWTRCGAACQLGWS